MNPDDKVDALLTKRLKTGDVPLAETDFTNVVHAHIRKARTGEALRTISVRLVFGLGFLCLLWAGIEILELPLLAGFPTVANVIRTALAAALLLGVAFLGFALATPLRRWKDRDDPPP